MTHHEDFNPDNNNDHDPIDDSGPIDHKAPPTPQMPAAEEPTDHSVDFQPMADSSSDEPLPIVNDMGHEPEDLIVSSDEDMEQDDDTSEEELRFKGDLTDEEAAEPSWFYVQMNERHGPAPLEHIQLLIRTQQLKADDLVWHEGMDEWTSVRMVDQLREVLPVSQRGAYSTGRYQDPHASQGGSSIPYSPSVPRGYGYRRPVGRSHEGSAITGFILSLVGIFFCGLPSLVGAVICKNALNGMERTRNLNGQGLAMAGYWIGVVAFGLWVLMFFCVICSNAASV